MLKDLDLIPVEAVQPVLRAEPHKSAAVLEDADDAPLGETLLDCEVIEEDVLLRAEAGRENEDQEGRQESPRRVAWSRDME